MPEDKKSKKIKDKFIPNVEVKEGRATELADGIADAAVGITRIAKEIIEAPIRAAGRIIDGAVEGAKQGLDQSSTPIEGGVKATTGSVIGGTKGIVQGVKIVAKKIGDGLSETGEGIKKVGNYLSPKKQEEIDD